MDGNSATGAGHGGAPGSLAGVAVLVIDDHPEARHLLALMLEWYGADVTTAGSVPEALDALERVRPTVLVSDIGMPDEDGYDLVRKVRQLPPERGGLTPAIAMTAYGAEHDRARALRAGFQAHLPKPIAWDHLVELIAELAGRR